MFVKVFSMDGPNRKTSYRNKKQSNNKNLTNVNKILNTTMHFTKKF